MKLIELKHIQYAVLPVLLFTYCATTIDVEYPVFPNTPDGRMLKKFISSKRNVGLIVEKKAKSYWASILETDQTSFLDLIPEKVFATFDEGGYYRLIDTSKREDILKEQVFSESGVTSKSLEIGNLLGTELLLFVKFEKPVTECAIEGKINKVSCGVSAGLAAYNTMNNQSSGFSKVGSGAVAAVACAEVPTGVRVVKVPLVGTLINPETGATMKAVSLGAEATGKSYSSAGNRSCPSALTAFDEALKKSAATLKKKLAPKIKTARIKIVRKDENDDVADFLNEGYMEVKGETPNYKKASENWEKALRVNPNSEGANANMATYYFATGNFDDAIIHYEKAMKAKGSKKDYWREQRKRVEATKNEAQ